MRWSKGLQLRILTVILISPQTLLEGKFLGLWFL